VNYRNEKLMEKEDMSGEYPERFMMESGLKVYHLTYNVEKEYLHVYHGIVIRGNIKTKKDWAMKK
jgi:hypothetical protein